MKEAIERVPPHNLEAEQAVLAAMLVDRDAITNVSAILSGVSFYRKAHGVIFETMIRIADRGDPVDLITVRDELGPLVDELGGYGYLVDLAASTPTTAHAEYYAGIVAEKAALRSLIHIGAEITASAFSQEDEPESIIQRAEKRIIEVSTGRDGHVIETARTSVFETVDDIEARYNNKGALLGLSTGFEDIDGRLFGCQAEDLILLAARPAMGKTSLMLNFARNIAVPARRPALIYSLEMGRKQLIERMIAAEAGVDANRMRSGYLTREDWEKVHAAAAVLADADFIIDDSGDLSIAEMRARSRRVQSRFPELGAIFVDYLQLVSGGPRFRGSDNRVNEMGEVSRGLKQMARELKVPVIALSQLSRSVEQRQDKRPMLSDLRESGTLEQDSDIVMFIYRDEYYNPETDKKAIAEVIIAKHRKGPTDTICLHFEKTQTKFSSISFKEPPDWAQPSEPSNPEKELAEFQRWQNRSA